MLLFPQICASFAVNSVHILTPRRSFIRVTERVSIKHILTLEVPAKLFSRALTADILCMSSERRLTYSVVCRFAGREAADIISSAISLGASSLREIRPRTHSTSPV